MSSIQTAVGKVFRLVAKNPEGAGLTVSLSGGGQEIVSPTIDSHSLAPLLARAGIYRGAQSRPEYDLKLYVEERAGQVSGRLERVTGVAFLETIPDPSETLAHFDSISWAEAEAATVKALEETLPNVALTVTSVVYRHNTFAQQSFEPGRGANQNRGLTKLCFGATPDNELRNFIADVVTRALDWDPDGRKADSINLWFTVNGECLNTIYTTINIIGPSYSVRASDHTCWPWNEKAIKALVPSKEHVRDKIVEYIGGKYAFELSQVQVYFAWSEALCERAG